MPRKGTSNPFYRHGFAKTAKKGSVYNTWASMRARCNNPNDNQYKDYGGRGIKVCPEWNDFMTFYKDVGERPEGHQLDRIDNDKNYCKENCRWADVVTQANNRRTTTFFSVENRKIARADLERELEISHEHFRRRLERYAIQVLQNKELSWDELRKIFKN